MTSEYCMRIGPSYTSHDFIERFKSHYSNADPSDFSSSGCRLFKLPFPCASFEDFLIPTNSDSHNIDPKELIDLIEQEARRLPFQQRSNDMFTFKQSVDIVNLEPSNQSAGLDNEAFDLLPKLRKFLLTDVLPWLESLTGATLYKDKVDFTSSVYGQNDVLLCHDDELESRRIAFILYLVPNDWDTDKEGGSLDLFSSHTGKPPESVPPVASGPPDSVYPWKITRSIGPRRNSFAFFEPSAFSFHQVAEVTGSRERLSVHGWFHGPSHPRPTKEIAPFPPSLVSPIHIEEELVYQWINPFYLDMAQQAKVRRHFIKLSEIQLVNFLKEEQLTNICNALIKVKETSWNHCGPYNRRNYDMLSNVSSVESDDIPDDIRALYRLLRSEAMLVVLSDLTGIQLHPNALQTNETVEGNLEPPSKRPNLSADSATTSVLEQLSDPQFRRWNVGSYTLLADNDVLNTGWRLEAILHLGGYGKKKRGWDTSWGGLLVYMAKDEEDELLSVIPVDNALTLVYTSPGTASFVKYINHSARPQSLLPSDSTSGPGCVYDIAVVYKELNAPVSDNEQVDADDEDEENAEEDTTSSDLSIGDEETSGSLSDALA